MKRVYIITAAVCLLAFFAFAAGNTVWEPAQREEALKVGFIFEGDESTPDAYNFAFAQAAVERQYADRARVFSRSNVRSAEIESPLRELVRGGCELIFTNSDSARVAELAGEYPEVQFCQISRANTPLSGTPENYHTFNAEIYQGRYVSGIAAGLKLRELIDSGSIRLSHAKVGFVAEALNREAISGFTAFLLGVRSIVPEPPWSSAVRARPAATVWTRPARNS